MSQRHVLFPPQAFLIADRNDLKQGQCSRNIHTETTCVAVTPWFPAVGNLISFRLNSDGTIRIVQGANKTKGKNIFFIFIYIFEINRPHVGAALFAFTFVLFFLLLNNPF